MTPLEKQLYEALHELADLMEDVSSGDYKPDSFTCQPARIAIREYNRQLEQEQQRVNY